ncbi:MAG: hypothetical protein JEY96_06780 [Bacteroidales bacterium]|nr:hypothetical protein [Bacteroidales bacterium]
MKTKIKNLLVLVIMLIATGAFAQQGNRKQATNEERLTKVILTIEKKIDINDFQKVVIEDAFSEFFTQVENERIEGYCPDKSVIDTYENERDQKIKAALSEDQYEEYLKISCRLRPQPQKRRNDQGQRPPKQN